MSEDMQMVLQMYREWRKEASGLSVEVDAECFFRGVPVRHLEEMLYSQSVDDRLTALEQRLSEQGINEIADAIEKRIVSRMKYGRNPRIEKGR